MPRIKAYLNGEYGLAYSFWFGLVIGGMAISQIASMLQNAVWRLYDIDAIISAVVVQFIVIALFVVIMGLAVGVFFCRLSQSHPDDTGMGGLRYLLFCPARGTDFHY